MDVFRRLSLILVILETDGKESPLDQIKGQTNRIPILLLGPEQL